MTRALRFAAVLLAALGVFGVEEAAAQTSTVNGLDLRGSPVTGDTYGLGEQITIEVTFTGGAVRVSSDVKLSVQIGSTTREFDCAETTCGHATLGSSIWRFVYVVQSGDADTDGITVSGLTGGTITRSAGGSVSRTLPGATGNRVDSSNREVDGSVGVGVTGLALNSPPGGDTFGRDDRIEATVTFSQAVDVTGAPQLALSIFGVSRSATYVSGDGTTSLLFRYTVVQADVDSTGLSIWRDGLTLNGGTIRLSGGTRNAARSLHNFVIANSADHKVNGATLTAAAVNGVSFASSPDDGGDTYRAGEEIEVEVTFNRAVDVVTTGGTPQLALSFDPPGMGAQTGQADYASGTGTNSLLFRYTVAAGDWDPDGISVAAAALTLNSGAINDARSASTAATLGLGTNAITNDANHKVDGGPVVTGLSVNTPVSGDTFEVGERIAILVTFNRAVAVTGTPQLALTIGTATRQAGYYNDPSDMSTGSGTRWQAFHYTVVAADMDADGLSIAEGALALNGGTIRAADSGRTDASLVLGAPRTISNLSSRKVDGSQLTAAAPDRLQLDSTPAASGTYGLGERIEASVRFNRAVVVTGTPQLALTIGTVTRQADYATGSGTNELRFRYVVQGPGSGGGGTGGIDADTDGISIGATALTLNGGAINDARSASTPAGLSLTSYFFNNATGHAVDGSALAAPAVTAVTVVSNPPAGGAYGSGAEIRVRVTFDRAVQVTGTPSLALVIGSARRQAAYVSGAGTADLVFRYTVQTGDADPDGLSVPADALALNGGTILLSGAIASGTTRPAAALGLGSHALSDVGDQTVAAVPPPPPPPPPSPRLLSIDAPRVVEGAPGTTATLRFTVTLSRTHSRTVAVAYEDAGTGSATAGDEGADYTAIVPGRLTFAPGTTTRTIDVAVIGDAEEEPDETVAVRLRSPVNATLATGAAVGTGTIVDDDADLKPTFGDAAVEPQRYVQNVAIAPLTLPAATGGNGPLTYTLTGPGPDGALPEGLVHTPPADAAASGGALTGTPAVAAEEATWTLTATDADGDTATLTFTVEVAPDLMPSFGDAQVPAQRYVQGVAIAPLALPGATGGNGALTYTLSPVLPEGLVHTPPADAAASGGALTGTPAAVHGLTRYTLTARDVDGDTATLTFTIEVLDRLRERLKGVNEAILPDLSRAMAASTVDAVAGRIGQALAPVGGGSGPMASAEVLDVFAGVLRSNEGAIEDGTWSWKRGLDGRTFALTLSGAGGDDDAGGGDSGGGSATGGGARMTFWGAGDYRNLDSAKGGGADWDGHLFGGHLGVDARFGAGGLAGLALSMTEGRFDYTDTSAYASGGTVEGKYESRMTSAHPYLGWAWGTGTHAWASMGYGRGDVTIIDGEAGRQKSDSRLRSAVAGGSVRVLSGEESGDFGPLTVDVKGEAWATWLEVEDNGDRIAELGVKTNRLRVSAEGARAYALDRGGVFTPSVELGMRLDGGDGETGAGVELGGGVDYAHPALGLSAELAGRVLVAHAGGADDWSVGGAVRMESPSGLGLSLRMAPSYGEAGGGLSRLWDEGVVGSGAGTTGTGADTDDASASTGQSPVARLDAEMGYGVAAFSGTLTPYGGLVLSEGGAHGYRLGTRYLLGPALEMSLEGEARESRTKRTEHSLMLRGRMYW